MLQREPPLVLYWERTRLFSIFVSTQRAIINKCPSRESEYGNKCRILVISHTGGTAFSYTNSLAFLEVNRHSYRRLISRGPVENVNSRKMPGSLVYSDTRDNHDVLLLIHPLNSARIFFSSSRKIEDATCIVIHSKKASCKRS